MSVRSTIVLMIVVATSNILPSAHSARGQCQVNELAKLTASDAGESDQFGVSVCVSGNKAVVGAFWESDAHEGSGAAYVYRREGTAWVEEAKLTASDAAAYDEFGIRVAVDGDVIVVGARNEGNTGIGPSNYGHGAAYVFRFHPGAPGAWVQEAKLVASDAIVGDRFGISVSVSGDVVVIGNHALFSDQLGSAYVFRFDGGGWNEEAQLTASDAATNDGYGRSVSLSGNVAVVGSWNDDDGGRDSGSAYIYRFDGSEWVEEQKLTASDAEAMDYFGSSVSVTGGVIVVGAWGDDEACPGDPDCRSGSAYVYRFHSGPPGHWVEEDKLTPLHGAKKDLFGDSVAVSGNVAVVGARNSGNTGGPYYDGPGLAYVYWWDATRWVQAATLAASDAASGDWFGRSVSVSGDVAVIGSRHTDDAGVKSGTAYVFMGVSDCNHTNTLDVCDISDAISFDCNANAVPDECDIADGTSEDVFPPGPRGPDGIPDECQILEPELIR